MTYNCRDYIKVIIKNIPISPPNNIVKEDWLVGQPANFYPEFSSGSTVLFWIQENHYRAIHFWKNDSYTYYYDHIVNPTVLDLYLHLGWLIFHITTFFHFLPFLCASTPPFWFPHYLRLLPTCQTVFFSVGRWMWNGKIFDDCLILPLILLSTISIALSLFLNHHHCLFILRSERDWCVSSCSEYFQYWVRFYGDHSIDMHHKLVGWFLFGIYRFYLVYFRWIVS